VSETVAALNWRKRLLARLTTHAPRDLSTVCSAEEDRRRLRVPEGINLSNNLLQSVAGLAPALAPFLLCRCAGCCAPICALWLGFT
jgi:hypothetical protein